MSFRRNRHALLSSCLGSDGSAYDAIGIAAGGVPRAVNAGKPEERAKPHDHASRRIAVQTGGSRNGRRGEDGTPTGGNAGV